MFELSFLTPILNKINTGCSLKKREEKKTFISKLILKKTIFNINLFRCLLTFLFYEKKNIFTMLI